jgi:hypothetical protein
MRRGDNNFFAVGDGAVTNVADETSDQTVCGPQPFLALVAG